MLLYWREDGGWGLLTNAVARNCCAYDYAMDPVPLPAPAAPLARSTAVALFVLCCFSAFH